MAGRQMEVVWRMDRRGMVAIAEGIFSGFVGDAAGNAEIGRSVDLRRGIYDEGFGCRLMRSGSPRRM